MRRVSAAIASWILKNEDPRKGVAVGYDTRFASRRAAEIAAETVAAAGIPVRLANDYTPTPVVSFAVRRYGCAGGVVVTSSHNPWNWNGIKFKAAYGGSATPAIMKGIEAELHAGAVPRATAAPV
ncbi:MAG: phosphoglucomutase/phosphomannomutase family protein, partial [Acidobacteria bacterium]|nr:phosphoglucomutase/phosphomannomutase family protein [Acidobacteriota bacterium]